MSIIDTQIGVIINNKQMEETVRYRCKPRTNVELRADARVEKPRTNEESFKGENTVFLINKN